MLFRKGRQLRLIPDHKLRDRLPVELVLAIDLTMAKHSHRFRWDSDKLAEALHDGAQQLPFLEEVQQAPMDKHEHLTAAEERPMPDDHWNTISTSVKQAAEKHVVKAWAGRTAEEEA